MATFILVSQDDRLISTVEVSKLTGVPVSTIDHWVSKDSFVKPEPIGRNYRYSLSEVLTWMKANDVKPRNNVDLTTLGHPRIHVPEGDQLLDTKALSAYLDIKRSWLNEAVSRNLLPQPDIRMGRPYPNFWYLSSIKKWFERPVPTFRYEQKLIKNRTVYTICVDDREIGVVFKDTDERWKVRGLNKMSFAHRCDAANWLYHSTVVNG